MIDQPNKPRMSLIPWRGVEAVAWRMTEGVAKHGERGGKLSADVTREALLESCGRHYLALMLGRTDEPHAAALACNSLRLAELEADERRSPMSADDIETNPHIPDSLCPIYLSGPITGQDADWTWRNRAAETIARLGGHSIDPLRGTHCGEVHSGGYILRGEPVPEEHILRDWEDVSNCGSMLVHFAYLPERQSIGTFYEMARAITLGKPVYLATTISMILNHPFIRTLCHWSGNDWEEAICAMQQGPVGHSD